MTGDRVCAYGAAERGPGVACCSVGADECRFRSLGSRPTDVLQVGGRVLAISPDGPVVVEDGLPFTDWMPLEWISDGFVGAARECAVYARDRDVRCPGGPSGVVLVDQLGRARFGR